MQLQTRTTNVRPIESAARKRERPETYPKGRICAERSCGTILSIYHEGPACHQCRPTRLPILGSIEELRELMEQMA